MNTFKAGQDNVTYYDVVAKSSGDAITSGTVNFYLIAKTGTNAGKWFKASDSSWSATEQLAGTASYKGGAAWSLSIASAAWISGVKYILYAKESGNLNIVHNEHYIDEADILTLTGITAGGTWSLAKVLKVILAWNIGNWQLKSGTTNTFEVIDPDDGTTVIAEVTASEDSPYKQVTIL